MQKNKLKPSFKIAVCLLAIAFSVLILPSCGKKKNNAEKSEPLIVACETSVAPYVYLNDATGEIVGADVDLVREVASRMGRNAQFVMVPFQHIVSMVSQEKADMGISSLSITPERQEKVLFSNAYDTLKYALIVPQNSHVTGLTSITTQRVAVKDGSSQAKKVRELAKNATVTYLLTDQQVLNSLVTRKSDVAVMNAKRAELFVAANKEYKLVDSGIPQEDIAIAFHSGNQSMKKDVDEILNQLKKTDFYATALKKHEKPVAGSSVQVQEKILVAALDTKYPPFVFQRDGKLSGLDLDIAKRVAAKMGCKLVLKQAPIEQTLEYVAEGKVDIGIGGLSATEERRGKMLFSESYADTRKVLLARSEDVDKVADIASVRLGVVGGTSNDDFLKILPAQPKSILRYANSARLIDGLIKGNVDVILDDSSVANIYCDRYVGKIQQVMELPDVEDYVFMIAPGRADVKKVADEVIQSMFLNKELPRLVHEYELKFITAPSDGVAY